ncbi:MAG TPA: DCC1-like thiol-disulfide oxidoreductase family protein [Planctomycetota bacterium]|nr:DCC1-like thiol-disulfide oxidoreductase family protein [Planctomycetota bacterium]
MTATADPAREPQPPIVFYDGGCGLCSRFVRRVARADRKGEIRFAPLQGETARALLPPLPADPARWGVLYLDEEGLHGESDATWRICKRAGGALRLLSWMRIIPRFVRNPVYRWIAKHRYRWFGRRDDCPVPDQAMRARLLP